ncbi:carbohydrate porin [Methyloceanibacter sp.]|uniref:carbohydrate porin n=1 Tax=Methyloceanibacter sp. TaxID=1965321 RepID=UPI003D6C7F02
MKRPEIRPLLEARRSLRAMALGGMLAACLAVMPGVARADCDVPDNGIPEETLLSKLGPGWASLGGLRPALAKGGIGISATYYGEAFVNSGGFNQGGKYDGVLDVAIDADLHKLGFWKGLCFHTNGFQIHGQSITADNIGSLMPVSNLEATPATRLFELWLEQHMFGDKLAVRFGQLAADAEFVISEGGGFFLNGTWGWPSITAADLPSGGPAYPLATPGVRVAVTPNDNFQLLVGLYNGDPAPPCASDDPQVCNNNGLDFELDDPPLLMVEGAYKYNQERLAGQVKIGGWNHFGDFEHQRFTAGGNLIAATGLPGKPLDNDWGFYGIIDQLIWRLPGSEDPKGVALFGRVIGAPSDRNLVDFYADGGITFSGMIQKRPDDSFAIGVAYTGISNQVHGFDIDSGSPVARNYEALLEICYTMQLATGWTLQPDFQYFWQPGGNVPDEDGRGAVENAAVFGARSTMSF